MEGGTISAMRVWSLVLIMCMTGLIFWEPVSGNPLPKGTSIGSVNVKTQSITLVLKRPGEGVRQVLNYKMDLGASITVDGTPVKLGKLHRGQRVVGYTEGSQGVLVSLDVQN
jgi:hypothetical protein